MRTKSAMFTSICLLIYIFNCQSNQCLQESNPKRDNISITTFGTTKTERVMSIQFNFVWWRRANDLETLKYDTSIATDYINLPSQYTSFWFTDTAHHTFIPFICFIAFYSIIKAPKIMPILSLLLLIISSSIHTATAIVSNKTLCGTQTATTAQWCYNVDIYPQPAIEVTDIVTIANGDDNMEHTYFDINIKPNDNDCIGPMIDFEFEEIDFAQTTEYLQVSRNDSTEITQCTGSADDNCGNWISCLTDYVLGDVAQINKDDTYTITIYEPWDVDAVCGPYSVHARLTIKCAALPSDPTGSISPTNIPTQSPTAVTPSPTTVTSSPTGVTPAPTSDTAAPTEVTTSPTTGTESPTGITLGPTSGTPSPTGGTEPPTTVTISNTAPTSNTTAPTKVTISPTSNTEAPTAVTPAPTSDTEAPTAVTSAPTSDTEAPTAVTTSNTEAPTAVTPAPTSNTEAPTAVTLQPTSSPTGATTDTSSAITTREATSDRTNDPTNDPTSAPTTSTPTTYIPATTTAPTGVPTIQPTLSPITTLNPSKMPTASPALILEIEVGVGEPTISPTLKVGSDDSSSEGIDGIFIGIIIAAVAVCCIVCGVCILCTNRKFKRYKPSETPSGYPKDGFPKDELNLHRVQTHSNEIAKDIAVQIELGGRREGGNKGISTPYTPDGVVNAVENENEFLSEAQKQELGRTPQGPEEELYASPHHDDDMDIPNAQYLSQAQREELRTIKQTPFGAKYSDTMGNDAALMNVEMQTAGYIGDIMEGDDDNDDEESQDIVEHINTIGADHDNDEYDEEMNETIQ